MAQSIGRPHSNVGMIGYVGGMPVSGGHAGTGAAPSWVSQGNGFSLPDFVQTGFAPGQSSFFNPGGTVSNQGLGRFDSGQQTPQQLMQNSGTWHASPANAEWSPTQVRPTQSGNMPLYQGAWGNAAQQANGMNSGVQQQPWTPQLSDANASGPQPMRPSGANVPGFEQTWRPGPNGTEGSFASGTNTMNFQNGGFAPQGSGVTGGTFLAQNNNRTQSGTPQGRTSSTVAVPNRTLRSTLQPRDIPGTNEYAGVVRDMYGNEVNPSEWAGYGQQASGTPSPVSFAGPQQPNVAPGGITASMEYYNSLAQMAGRAGGEGEPPGATAIRDLGSNAGMPISYMPYSGNASSDFGYAESFSPQQGAPMTPADSFYDPNNVYGANRPSQGQSGQATSGLNYWNAGTGANGYGSGSPPPGMPGGGTRPNRPVQGQQAQPTGYSGYNFTAAPPPRPMYGGGTASGGSTWNSGSSGQGYGNYVGPPQPGSSGSSGSGSSGYPGMIGPPMYGPGPASGSGTSVGIGTQNGGSQTVSQYGQGNTTGAVGSTASGTALTRGARPGWQFQFMQDGTLPEGYAMSRPRPGTFNSPSPITAAPRPGLTIAPQGNMPYTPRQSPAQYATRPAEYMQGWGISSGPGRTSPTNGSSSYNGPPPPTTQYDSTPGTASGGQYGGSQYGSSNSSSYTTTQRMPTQTYVNSSRQQYRY